ncbi:MULTISPECIES: serpin family protein [Gordonibacter]|uniref:Serpin family protein n=1 Tax=Gordonibacter faecis TaxID=3047475 RepID=A0ABT7DKM6_9ACTN|nr:MULTISPECIES: serpin family protein [unclassified Gordonibacter]MDJ1650082.1 serpin family protein [Gordonibacter sp. KGMB12511]HIW75527.1 serpin family protein [Candidatus Gordonibacter avicola]
MRKRWLVVGGLVVALAAGVGLLAGCGSAQQQGGEPDPAPTPGPAPSTAAYDGLAVAQPAIPEKPAEDDYDTWMNTLDANPVDFNFTQSLSAFAYRSAAAVLDPTTDAVGANANVNADASVNSAYSPLSLYYALALAGEGAAGTTAEQIAAALGTPANLSTAEQCGNLFRVLATDPQSEVTLANSLWLGKDTPFEQAFIDTAINQFYATPFSAEFGTAATDAAIASWISDNTGGLINPQVQTDASQILSIINAIYFKGSWSDPFDTSATTQEVFHAEQGDVQVDFMTQRLESPQDFRRTDTYLRASRSFGGGASMTFVLPAEGTSAADLMADPAALEEAFTAPSDDLGRITYIMPKATFDSSFDLIPALKRLGVEDAFGDAANFSNLTSTPAFISEVKQESHVTWDEEGAEAGAYTNMGIAKMALPPENVEEVELRLDRPFLFQITSSQGIPLFIGICGDPTKTA